MRMPSPSTLPSLPGLSRLASLPRMAAGTQLSRLPAVVARREAAVAPSVVWPWLVDPRRWVDWDPLVADVEGVDAPVEGGERFRTVLPAPVGPLRRLTKVTVDVGLVDPDIELGLVTYPQPGVITRVRYRVLALPGGRSDCEVRVTLHGLLAAGYWPAVRVAAERAVTGLVRTAERSMT